MSLPDITIGLSSSENVTLINTHYSRPDDLSGSGMRFAYADINRVGEALRACLHETYAWAADAPERSQPAVTAAIMHRDIDQIADRILQAAGRITPRRVQDLPKGQHKPWHDDLSKIITLSMARAWNAAAKGIAKLHVDYPDVHPGEIICSLCDVIIRMCLPRDATTTVVQVGARTPDGRLVESVQGAHDPAHDWFAACLQARLTCDYEAFTALIDQLLEEEDLCVSRYGAAVMDTGLTLRSHYYDAQSPAFL